MNELALFAGAGGGVWASKLLGHRIVCYVEREPYCQRVIEQRIRDGVFDDAPIWDDVATFDGKPWRGVVDLVSAGFPCQPFSVTGKHRGESDERNLLPDTIRIIREVRPRLAFLENVPALLACSVWPALLGDLAESGFDAEWGVLSAATLGAPHVRKRLWLLAYSEGTGLEGLREGLPGQCRWWEAEPDVGRVADGMAHRRHRIAALGNGQVPLVAASAFRLLLGRIMSST